MRTTNFAKIYRPMTSGADSCVNYLVIRRHIIILLAFLVDMRKATPLALKVFIALIAAVPRNGEPEEVLILFLQVTRVEL